MTSLTNPPLQTSFYSTHTILGVAPPITTIDILASCVPMCSKTTRCQVKTISVRKAEQIEQSCIPTSLHNDTLSCRPILAASRQNPSLFLFKLTLLRVPYYRSQLPQASGPIGRGSPTQRIKRISCMRIT